MSLIHSLCIDNASGADRCLCDGDRWDIVQEVTITAHDDLNIDQLEQTMLVSAVIHSLDTEYEALGVVATINGVFSECLALDTECSVYS